MKAPFMFLVHPMNRFHLRLFYMRRGRWNMALFLPRAANRPGGRIFSCRFVMGEEGVGGSIFLLPLTPSDILDEPAAALEDLVRAVEEGIRRGYGVVGLGGALSYLWQRGGAILTRFSGVTGTGIPLTVFTAVENLLNTARLLGVDLEKGGEPVGIPGFPSPAARLSALLLLEKGARVTLLEVEETRVLERFLRGVEDRKPAASIGFSGKPEGERWKGEGRFILSPLPGPAPSSCLGLPGPGSVVVDLTRGVRTGWAKEGVLVMEGEMMRLRDEGVRFFTGIWGLLYNLFVRQGGRRGLLACFVEPVVRAMAPAPSSEEVVTGEWDDLGTIRMLGESARGLGFVPTPLPKGLRWWQGRERIVERFRRRYFPRQI